MVMGAASLGAWTVALAGFAGGILATALVYTMARGDGRTEVVTLVLVGIAVNASAGAVIGLLMFYADENTVRAIAFWNLGSLASASWSVVAAVVPCVIVGIAVAMRHRGSLDLLALGERTAATLGVRVERLRVTLIVVTCLLTAAAVSFTGVVAFVGLVVPHIIRAIAGPGHRVLVPASALLGAAVLVAGDLVARTLVDYQELPLGVLTALIGAPTFFVLLRRTRARAGGWG
jgi:iron complex transport system permease protein